MIFPGHGKSTGTSEPHTLIITLLKAEGLQLPAPTAFPKQTMSFVPIVPLGTWACCSKLGTFAGVRILLTVKTRKVITTKGSLVAERLADEQMGSQSSSFVVIGTDYSLYTLPTASPLWRPSELEVRGTAWCTPSTHGLDQLLLHLDRIGASVHH